MNSFPVTIILPTYNERENLERLLPTIKSFKFPVIVVDDNSPDNTCDIATDHGVHLILRKDERGLGSAIRKGAEFAKTPYVAVMDSDGQHDPLDLLMLIMAMSKYQGLRDIIIGSRFKDGTRIEGLPRWRQVATKVLNFIGGVRAKTKTTDYLTGMFVCRTEYVRSTSENGFKILYDILKNNKLRAEDVPVTLHERFTGKSKANFTEITKYLRLVFS